jgi:hypothetical protein
MVKIIHNIAHTTIDKAINYIFIFCDEVINVDNQIWLSLHTYVSIQVPIYIPWKVNLKVWCYKFDEGDHHPSLVDYICGLTHDVFSSQ